MLNTFTKDYEAAPREAKEQYKKIVDGYSIFGQDRWFVLFNCF